MKANKEGVWGEIHAARHMRDNGYKILACNFSCRFGEIDIVGCKDGYICFVEVKTRGEGAISAPKEAVDAQKQSNIIASSKLFIQLYQYTQQPRFDVCEVFVDDKIKPVKINYIENAFSG
ncbi:MAG: YraN family protein [Clostridia bacterium]|nr:YraN family protein [Clostridia bacterium]